MTSENSPDGACGGVPAGRFLSPPGAAAEPPAPLARAPVPARGRCSSDRLGRCTDPGTPGSSPPRAAGTAFAPGIRGRTDRRPCARRTHSRVGTPRIAGDVTEGRRPTSGPLCREPHVGHLSLRLIAELSHEAEGLGGARLVLRLRLAPALREFKGNGARVRAVPPGLRTGLRLAAVRPRVPFSAGGLLHDGAEALQRILSARLLRPSRGRHEAQGEPHREEKPLGAAGTAGQHIFHGHLSKNGGTHAATTAHAG